MAFDLDGERFEIGKLNAFEQLTLLRKLASASPILQQIVAPENRNKDRVLLIMFALSQVDDANMDAIIKIGLKDARVFRNDIWAPLITKSGGLMFDDLKLATFMRLIGVVFEENLGDFFLTALDALDLGNQE